MCWPSSDDLSSWKFVLIFPSEDYYFSFCLFIIVYSSLVNLFLITFLTLSDVSLCFSSNSSFLIRNDIHLVSSKSLLYAFIFEVLYIKVSTFLPPSYSIKCLKLFLPKESLLENIILLMSTSFIEIGILYWWNLCFSTSVLATKFF